MTTARTAIGSGSKPDQFIQTTWDSRSIQILEYPPPEANPAQGLAAIGKEWIFWSITSLPALADWQNRRRKKFPMLYSVCSPIVVIEPRQLRR